MAYRIVHGKKGVVCGGKRDGGRNRKSFEFNENGTDNHLFRLIRKKVHAHMTNIRNETGDITIMKE